MNDQESGLVTRLVAGMVRRSLKARFRGIYWNPPSVKLSPPVLFVCNHHGWFDGYVMHRVTRELGLPMLLWVQEFEAFPLFAKLGAMPFPADDPTRRAATIKRTLRLMKDDRMSLVLLPEGKLHDPPELLPFGETLDFMLRKAPEAPVVPVALRYEFALHERPECFVAFGEPVSAEHRNGAAIRAILESLLDETGRRVREDRDGFEVLFKGTGDVNERFGRRGRKR